MSRNRPCASWAILLLSFANAIVEVPRTHNDVCSVSPLAASVNSSSTRGSNGILTHWRIDSPQLGTQRAVSHGDKLNRWLEPFANAIVEVPRTQNDVCSVSPLAASVSCYSIVNDVPTEHGLEDGNQRRSLL